jgi:hypothetical protein
MHEDSREKSERKVRGKKPNNIRKGIEPLPAQCKNSNPFDVQSPTQPVLDPWFEYSKLFLRPEEESSHCLDYIYHEVFDMNSDSAELLLYSWFKKIIYFHIHELVSHLCHLHML